MNNDQKLIQVVLDKFYAIISGRAGEERDWQAFRELFFYNAILTNHVFTDDYKCGTIIHNVESYINRLRAFLDENDFFEKGLINRIDFFCNIAQVDSFYKAKRNPVSNEIIKAGKNFIQLLHDGTGWKIVSMLWENE